MNNLNFYLEQARLSRTAIGHFNFATEDVLKAIVAGAKEAGAPCVMVGTSEGEADFVGLKEAVALVRAVADDMQFPVFLNADHFKSFDKCKEAIDAGYDSIIADGSKLPMAENIAFTKQVVDYAKEVSTFKNLNTRPNGSSGRVSVEGELGYLKGTSEVQTKVEISPADFSKPEEVADFVAQTGVDRMAVVFGNIHGIVKEVIHIESTPTPGGVGVPTEASGAEKLDIEHLKKIVAQLQRPPLYNGGLCNLVLHGASGLRDEDIKLAIQAGITNIHFNTELRVAYHDKLKEEFTDPNTSNETTPYKYLAPAAEEVKKLVTEKIRIFMGQ